MELFFFLRKLRLNGGIKCKNDVALLDLWESCIREGEKPIYENNIRQFSLLVQFSAHGDLLSNFFYYYYFHLQYGKEYQEW